MIGKLIIIVFILLFFPNYAVAEYSKLNVSVEIITYDNYEDAFVVGDSFFYKINLTNPMSEKITSDFSVTVYNPANVSIESTINYTGKTIEPNQSIEIVAKGGKDNETAAFPFDIAGDYKLILESTKPFDFYRWIKIRYTSGNNTIVGDRYIRTPLKFVYYFDVMPTWQYHLWKEEEKINKQSLDLSQKMYEINTDIDTVTKEMNQATQEMNIVTQQMNEATQDMKGATYIMLLVAIISLVVARKKS